MDGGAIESRKGSPAPLAVRACFHHDERQMTTDAEPLPAGRVTLRDFRFNPSVLEGALPVLVFWVVNQFADAPISISASFLAAIVVFVRNKQSGVIRALGVLGFVIVAASAGVGLVLDSDKAFAAQNIVSDFVVVPIALGSLVIGRPLAGAVGRELFPAIRPLVPERHAVFVLLTLLVVAINLSTGLIRLVMIDALSTNDYVILSRVIGVPFNILLFGLGYLLVFRVVERELAVNPHLRPQRLDA
jgi:hypothetical protein